MISFRDYINQVKEEKAISESAMNEEAQASLQAIEDALINTGRIKKKAQ